MAVLSVRRRILLVDAWSDEREMYAETLRAAGWLVLEARDPDEAVDLVEDVAPDVVVMDLHLYARVDGLALLQTLRRTPSTRWSALVMLSGGLPGTWEEAARSAGCDLVLQKPCLPDDLEFAVGHAEKARGLTREAGRGRDVSASAARVRRDREKKAGARPPDAHLRPPTLDRSA
jgi:CheY-like chemotaxis protein